MEQEAPIVNVCTNYFNKQNIQPSLISSGLIRMSSFVNKPSNNTFLSYHWITQAK
jgi:hypothetical protein